MKMEKISTLIFISIIIFTDYESILQNVKSKMNIKALKDSEIMLLHKDDLQKLYQKEAYWQEFGRKMTEVIYLSAQKRIEELLYYVPKEDIIIYYQKILRYFS